MAKRPGLLFLVLTLALTLYAQEVPVEEGSELTAGKAATLGVEASTGFAWDIDNKSTGLETKAGMELIFPLFPNADRGIYPDNFDDPAVRLALRNASFTWWNTFEVRGGNYEQDSFNRWSARPLVLTFDDFYADVVWKNYFFRIASSTTVFQTDTTSLYSIFDEVMDAIENRWYIGQSQSLDNPTAPAAWRNQRYNIQNLPILKGKIERNYVDDDYRNHISGMLALGAEFEWLSAAIKVASNQSGQNNNDNAWLLGADIEAVPIENLLFTLTGFVGFNYEKTAVGKNPLSLGASVEYRLPLSDRYFLTPRVGFDFAMDTAAEESEWELGAGVLFHTRGYDFLVSSRVLDWDNVIPVGASAFVNLNQDNGFNIMVSWFEPAGSDSMLPNFGGFLQIEVANLLEANNSKSALAALAQVEYMIAGKFTPYIRGGYRPVFQSGSNTAISGDYLIKAALGCYMTPIHFFSVDLRYEMDALLPDVGDSKIERNLLSIVFTVRM
ncbi:MAG: hypothetical protein LBI06_05970 [Treponema sp.]|nr:hypothetical protein [Treponema sp.]